MNEEQWQEWKRAEAERHRQEREEAEEALLYGKVRAQERMTEDEWKRFGEIARRRFAEAGLK